MTARKTRTAPEITEVEIPAEPTVVSYGPTEGGNAIAVAWRGLYNLFGARFSDIAISPEGFTFSGITVDEPYDINVIISDIYNRGDKTVNPRLDFLELYPLMSGETPEPFTNANQITAWMVKHMKGGSRSPKYAKEANQAYKVANGFAVHRGRPRTIFRIKDIGSSLNEAALADVDPQEVEKLKATIASWEASQAQAVVVTE